MESDNIMLFGEDRQVDKSTDTAVMTAAVEQFKSIMGRDPTSVKELLDTILDHVPGDVVTV